MWSLCQAGTPRHPESTGCGAAQECFEFGAVAAELRGIRPGWPGPQVGEDGWCGAEHGDAGAERQRADAVGRQDRDAADRALVGAGAVVAEGHGVGVLVAFTDERAQVLEVARVGGAAEDDLDDAGVPDRAGRVVAPLVPCLGQGLEDGQGGDAGTAAFGHQRGQAGQGCEVADLVQR